MTRDKDWSDWVNVTGSVASIAAFSYLLLHLPRRKRSGSIVAGLAGTLLSGSLPKRGPLPASAVAYAMKKLQRQVKKCRITPDLMREGMEVEREHQDVTRGGIERTARIATAHLCERKDYYQRLKKYVE